METVDNLEQNTQVLEVTENAKKYLKTTSSWTFFMAVLSFVGIAVLALGGIIMLIMVQSNLADGIADVLSSGLYSFLGFFYLAMAIVMVFPALFLLRFSQKTKSALATQNANELEEGIENMKSYWKFSGIMTIVMLALVLVVMIIAVITSANAMSGMYY